MYIMYCIYWLAWYVKDSKIDFKSFLKLTSMELCHFTWDLGRHWI
jgi:hypothetical protein